MEYISKSNSSLAILEESESFDAVVFSHEEGNIYNPYEHRRKPHQYFITISTERPVAHQVMPPVPKGDSKTGYQQDLIKFDIV